MGGNLREHLYIVAFVVILCTACADEGLDGPDRLQFDDIYQTNLSIERGEVMILGRDEREETVIDRWTSNRSGFANLEERESGGELFVDSQCNQSESCRVRYDMSVSGQSGVEATIENGELNLVKNGGAIEAVVQRGRLEGSRLAASYADLTVIDGTARLSFAEPPGNLMLRVGQEASMTVLLPTDRYRCNFTEEADSIQLGDVQCTDKASNTLRVDPPDATVRFVVDRPDR